MQLTFIQRIHPLVFLTFAFMCGIAAYKLLALPFILLGGLILPIIALLSCPVGFAHSYSVVIACVCLVGTYGLGALRIHQQLRNHHSFYTTVAPDLACNLSGCVTNINQIDHPCFSYCITVHVTDGWQNSAAIKPNHNIQLYVRTLPDIMVDDTIALNDLIIRPETPNAPFSNYLLKEGVAATLFCQQFNFKQLARPHYSVARWLYTKKQLLVAELKKSMNPQTFQLFSSLFLGYKAIPKRELEKTKEHFSTWGVTHYLARSGLHMVIFVISWHFLFSFLPLPFLIKELLLVLLSLIYCLLSWPSVSFNRAFLTFFCYKIALFGRQATDVLHILSIVCLVILFDNPMQLFFLDFQLSFGLTFALAYFNQLHTHIRHQQHETVAS